MNSTAHLLSMVDAQLKHCPPRLRDLRVISADYTDLLVLHRFYPVLVNGWPERFRVLRVWCSDARECCAMSTVFSLN